MRRIALILGAAVLAVATAAGPVAARQSGLTIVETAVAVNQQSGEFDHLIAAVVRADLVGTLDGNRRLTVFAPTDAAFEDLFDALGVTSVNDIPLETLRAVLLHHVAPGQRFSGDVLASSRIRTLNRDFATPSIQGGQPYIDGARIVLPDVRAANGVIHVIDAVILPGA
jgi:uncharacterized surface protein with fasciclin (FAS1) repeats